MDKSPQLDAAVKATQILFMIRQTFVCLASKVLKPKYSVFIRLHLKYCGQAWTSHLRHVNKLERVQRLATIMVFGFHLVPYEQRLVHLNLFPVNSFDNADSSQFFGFLTLHKRRGHALRFSKKGVRLVPTLKTFFTDGIERLELAR